MSPPIKTPPSVSPGVQYFWCNGPAKGHTSLSHVTITQDIDLAALQDHFVRSGGLTYAKRGEDGSLGYVQELNELVGRVQDKNMTMLDELRPLFSTKEHLGKLQYYDKNDDFTINPSELAAIRNHVDQQLILSVKYLIDHQGPYDCKNLEKPSKAVIAGQEVDFKRPEKTMKEMRSNHEEDLFATRLWDFGIAIGALGLFLGVRYLIKRRVAKKHAAEGGARG